jgi:DNA-binding transcriptional ArsR family regulator
VSEPAAQLDDTLAALADPARRRMVELLAQRPHRAGELAAAVDISPSAASKHLRVLRRSGIVDDTHPEFDARVRVYSLHAAHMTELRDWLARTEAGWTAQLTAFAEHLRTPT